MFEIFKDRRVQIGLFVLTVIFMIIGTFRIDLDSNKYDVTLPHELLTSLENSKLLNIEKKNNKKNYVTYRNVKFVLPNEKFKQDKTNEKVYYYEKNSKTVAALRIDSIFNVYTMLKDGKYEELNALEYDYATLFEKYSISSFTELFKYIRKNYKTEIKDDMSEDEKMMIYLSNSLLTYELKGDIYIIEGNVKGFMCVHGDIFDVFIEKNDEIYNFTFINNKYKLTTLDSVKTFLENVIL